MTLELIVSDTNLTFCAVTRETLRRFMYETAKLLVQNDIDSCETNASFYAFELSEALAMLAKIEASDKSIESLILILSSTYDVYVAIDDIVLINNASC